MSDMNIDVPTWRSRCLRCVVVALPFMSGSYGCGGETMAALPAIVTDSGRPQVDGSREVDAGELAVPEGAATTDQTVDAADTGGASTGLVGPAKALSTGWSDAVTARCQRCSSGDLLAGCIAEDAALVPNPFALICLSQLASSDAAVRGYLDARAEQEKSFIERWGDPSTGCAVVPAPPSPLPVPPGAVRCFTNRYTCPEQTVVTACNGVAECLAGDDERACGVIPPAFVCHHGANVAWSRVCDGQPDCEFAEDEANCYARE
jgi:hypothetical protein